MIRISKIIRIYNFQDQDRDQDKDNDSDNDKKDKDKEKERDKDRKKCINRIKKDLNPTEEQTLKDNQKNNILNVTRDQNRKNH